MQTNYNEVVILQQGDVLMKKWQVQEKKTHERQRDVRENEETKMKMEVQEITFHYFARPQPRDLNFYVMMVIQKILLSVVSKFVVGVWEGLDACEISRPEILSQSAPVCVCVCVCVCARVYIYIDR